MRMLRLAGPALVVVGIAAGCGGGSTGPSAGAATTAEPAHARPRPVQRLHLTRVVPAALTSACRDLQERLDREGTARPVVCPPLVPMGQLRAQGYPLAGVRPGRPGRSYAMDVQSADLPHAGDSGGHWLVAAGTRSALRIAGLVDLVPVPARPVATGPYAGEIRKLPPFPRGGVNGGHVVVSFRAGGVLYLVSLHGYRNTGRAVLMARALAASVAATPGATVVARPRP